MTSTLPSYFEELKTIKDKYKGSQDTIFESEELKRSHQDYLQTPLQYLKTVKLEPSSQPVDFGRKAFFELPRLIELAENKMKLYAYKNLRLGHSRHNQMIKSVELEIGGSQIDRVYGIIFKALRELYQLSETQLPFYWNRENHYLPIVEWHQYKIRFEFAGQQDPNESLQDFELLADVYEMEYKPEIRHIITQIEYTGAEPVGPSSSLKIKLCHHGLSTHLLLVPEDYEIADYQLQLDGTKLSIDLKQCPKCDNVIIIPFTQSLEYADVLTHSLPFGRIDYPLETIETTKTSTESTHHTFSISLNIAWMAHGMYTVIFSP